MGSKPSFKKVAASLAVHKERTIRVPLPRVISNGDGVPTLLLKYAGEGTPGTGKRASINEQVAAHPNSDNAALLRMGLYADWYAEFAVEGWENVYSDDGTPAEFNQENCALFLREIATLDGADMYALLSQCFDRNLFRDPLPSAVAVGKG